MGNIILHCGGNIFIGQNNFLTFITNLPPGNIIGVDQLEWWQSYSDQSKTEVVAITCEGITLERCAPAQNRI